MKRFARTAACVLAMTMLHALPIAGCKKKAPTSEHALPSPPAPTPSGSPTSNVVYRDRGGCSMRTAQFMGHEGPASNTYEADCPAALLDAGEAPSTAKRPAGKDDWIRLKSSLAYEPYRKACSFYPERFCTPEGRKGECTPQGPITSVACTSDAASGKMTFKTFVYADGVNTCHRVLEGACKIGVTGSCDTPSGDVVPCPADD